MMGLMDEIDKTAQVIQQIRWPLRLTWAAMIWERGLGAFWPFLSLVALCYAVWVFAGAALLHPAIWIVLAGLLVTTLW
ncbi:MAG: hypothetical protein O2824_05830, partial [Proteobacteria bacterium]|nr:hypothetical protein [Pseudomonadota bacterium]